MCYGNDDDHVTEYQILYVTLVRAHVAMYAAAIQCDGGEVEVLMDGPHHGANEAARHTGMEPQDRILLKCFVVSIKY